MRGSAQVVRVFRVAYRSTLIAVWTAFMAILRVLALAIMLVSPQLEQSVRRWAFRRWARVILAICHARVTLTGRPPKAPFFSVSNHLSNLDLVLMAYNRLRVRGKSRFPIGR